MFWGVSNDLYNVNEILGIQEAVMADAKSRRVSESDMTLLESAFKHVCVLTPLNTHSS